MRKVLLLILLGVATMTRAQEWPLKTAVSQKKTLFAAAPVLRPFTLLKSKQLEGRGQYQLLQLNRSFQRLIMEQSPEVIQLELPLDAQHRVTLELIKFSLGNMQFTENNSAMINDVVAPVSYRGIVKGETTVNNAVLTVNDWYLSLVIGLDDRVIQLTKADETDAIYRLYDSRKLQFPSIALDCGTAAADAATTKNGISLTGMVQPTITAVQDKCVNVFVDCFDSLYQWRGSSKQQTISYVFELFGLVVTGFYNEQINMQLTTINVWTADPFRQTSRDTALRDMARYYKDNFWGNICVGLDYSIAGNGRSGIADGIGVVKGVSVNTCPIYSEGTSAICYNDLDYNVTVQNFPTGPNTTGPQLYLLMHEIGHLIGAHHTKWCGWQISNNPVTFGTLDSCGTIEGNCVQGPPPPATGATIMSYCVGGGASGNFVNYNNGFGTLPGNAIRNFVANNNCIVNCTDCFGKIPSSAGADIAYVPPRPPLRPIQEEVVPGHPTSAGTHSTTHRIPKR